MSNPVAIALGPAAAAGAAPLAEPAAAPGQPLQLVLQAAPACGAAVFRMDEDEPPTEPDPSLVAARLREELRIWESVRRSVQGEQGPEAVQVVQLAQQHIRAARVGITKSKPLAEQLRVLDTLLRAREAAVQKAHEALSTATANFEAAYSQLAAARAEHAQVAQDFAAEEAQEQRRAQERALVAARAEADERLRRTPGIAEAVAGWARRLNPEQQAAAMDLLVAVGVAPGGSGPAPPTAAATWPPPPPPPSAVLDTGSTADDVALLPGPVAPGGGAAAAPPARRDCTPTEFESDFSDCGDEDLPSPVLGRRLAEAAGRAQGAAAPPPAPPSALLAPAAAEAIVSPTAAPFGPAHRPFGRGRVAPYAAPLALEEPGFRAAPALDRLD